MEEMTVTPDLQGHAARSIEYWCFRLSDYQLNSELETEVWLRILSRGVWEPLEAIWQNPDPIQGGVRGVSRYLSRICTNVFRDVRRKKNAKSRIPEALIVSLAQPIDPNGEDPDGDDNLTVEDTITGDEGSGYQSFLVADFAESLTPEEIALVDDTIAGFPLREIGERHKYGKTSAGRIRDKVAKKLKEYIDGLMQNPKPIRFAVPLVGRSSYRPDRTDQPNLLAFHGNLAIREVQPFFPCRHAEEAGDQVHQDFSLPGATQGPGRYALCNRRNAQYWRKLRQWLKTEIFRLADSIGAAALGTPRI